MQHNRRPQQDAGEPTGKAHVSDTLTIPSAAPLVYRTKVLPRIALVRGRSLRQVQA
jgi:hypothetical protein